MISLFMLNVVLAVLWMLLTGNVDIYSLLLGFILGYLAIGLLGRVVGGSSYGVKVWRLLSFAGYFLRILIVANLEVAREVVTPGFSMSPRLIRYSVKGMTPAQITTLAGAITLTPGTLSVDVDEPGESLFVHAMYARDRDAAVRQLDELRDALLREVFG